MTLFHLHRWVTTSEVFSPPVKGVESCHGTARLIMQLTLGITSIRQACARCGAVRVVDALGDVRTESAKEVAW